LTKTTRRAAFLGEMERVVPWSALCGLIEPFYPKPGNGRPPIDIERMLRIYFLQQWFNLSDPAVEETLYDSQAMRRFVGIDLGREPVPDETTVCRFRHLLEEHDLGRPLFDEVQRHLAAKGLRVATGTIVDATIINAPSSTKNADKAHDPEMHQTKKGNQWYFGMKGHFGVDSRSKLIQAVVATPANVADSKVLPDPLHGNETRMWGDQAYRGQRAVIREHAPRARDFTNRRYRHRGVVDEVERAKNRTNSKVRAKVEHAIGVIKRVFGFAKVRYRGLNKNAHRLMWPVHSPSCSSRAAIFCAATWRNLPRSATFDCRPQRHHANNDRAASTLSPIAATSMPDLHSQLLVQSLLSTRRPLPQRGCMRVCPLFCDRQFSYAMCSSFFEVPLANGGAVAKMSLEFASIAGSATEAQL
jgi:transposase, IS5 family